MLKKTSLIRYSLFILLLTAGISAVMARWTEGGWTVTFGAAALISLVFLSLAVFAWYRAGRSRMMALMMALTFVLHLGFGLAAVRLLPEHGHPGQRREEMGFLFDDAWRRDEEAWTIHDDLTFADSLTYQYHNDQYGGLAAMSVWLYKYISPDARRFPLIMLIGAFFIMLGLPFFWKGLSSRWDRRITLIGCWIYTLYPDSIFFSGAPMREPFLIGILAAAFWALVTLREHRSRSALILAVCFLACLPFSSMVAAALAGACLLWIWAEMLVPRSKAWLWGGIVFAVIGILAAVIVALPAFQEWVHYDIHTTEVGSGWVEKVVGEIGGQFRSIFVAVYGLTQPVLPAIAVYPTPPACDLAKGPCTTMFWKVTGIFRAAGWYALIPFLLYAVFSTFRIRDKQERMLMITNAVFVLVWMFIASLRAGGDQIDNPRYRVIFLPWLAFLSAWGIDYALKMKDRWLVRWLLIELIFLGFFTQWYYSRYSGDAIRRYPFWRTVIYICICSAVVFAEGIVRDIIRRKPKSGELK